MCRTSIRTKSRAMRGPLVWCLVLSAMLAGCWQDSAATPTPVATPLPTLPATATTEATAATLLPTATTASAQYKTAYKATRCPFGTVPAAECGLLTVPEDRSRPEGRTIDLFVAVLKSASARPEPDPLIFLEGGPGVYTVMHVGWLATVLSGALGTRDVIFLDQRGTGLSRPALECPEQNALAFTMLEQGKLAGKAPPEMEAATLACRDRLIKEGNNLSAYNTAENAADVEDLRLALGYKQWNLLGLSYGTSLALTVMRNFPAGVRSVILDSPLPPLPAGTGLPGSAANIDRSLDMVFKECAADAACNGAYPNLEQALYDTVDRLNKEPYVVTGTLTLTGDEVLLVLADMLNDPTTIAGLPKMIYEAYDGFYVTPMSQLQRTMRKDDFSEGMSLSVWCSDFVSPITREQRAAGDSAYPRLNYVFSAVREYDFCSMWGMGQPDPDANRPVRSDIPALVLTGQFDISTPPEYGDIAVQTLSRGYHFTFPGLGHGQIPADSCPASIAWAFLADPGRQPDASCVHQMKGPQWEVGP